MSNRKSYLGKLYDTVQKEVDENAWVTELVDNIKTDLNYSILATSFCTVSYSLPK